MKPTKGIRSPKAAPSPSTALARHAVRRRRTGTGNGPRGMEPPGKPRISSEPRFPTGAPQALRTSASHTGLRQGHRPGAQCLLLASRSCFQTDLTSSSSSRPEAKLSRNPETPPRSSVPTVRPRPSPTPPPRRVTIDEPPVPRREHPTPTVSIRGHTRCGAFHRSGQMLENIYTYHDGNCHRE